MSAEIRLNKLYYPKISQKNLSYPDHGHLYLEYYRLYDTARDLEHIKDTVMRDVFREEIERRQCEILKIIKIN